MSSKNLPRLFQQASAHWRHFENGALYSALLDSACTWTNYQAHCGQIENGTALAQRLQHIVHADLWLNFILSSHQERGTHSHGTASSFVSWKWLTPYISVVHARLNLHTRRKTQNRKISLWSGVKSCIWGSIAQARWNPRIRMQAQKHSTNLWSRIKKSMTRSTSTLVQTKCHFREVVRKMKILYSTTICARQLLFQDATLSAESCMSRNKGSFWKRSDNLICPTLSDSNHATNWNTCSGLIADRKQSRHKTRRPNIEN